MNSVSLPIGLRRSLPRGSLTATWRRLTREPLLHFALLGAAIFVGAHLLEQAKADSQATIIVDDGLRDRLGNLYRTQFGVAPTKAQLQVVVDDYVDDEVLYREALRLGLDQDDEIIRRRLIQKLEFLQRDSLADANPPPAQLRAYYQTHSEQFATGARASFTHVYFNPDRGGEREALARANSARAQLLTTGGPIDDDAFPLESSYARLTRDDAIRIFGASGFVDTLFTAPTAEWSAPVRSGFGWHLFKVTAMTAPNLAPFEKVMPDVRAAYLQQSTARARRQQLDALRTRYQVLPRGTAP